MQRFKKLRGGALELTLGPAERPEVEAWVRTWGSGVVQAELKEKK